MAPQADTANWLLLLASNVVEAADHGANGREAVSRRAVSDPSSGATVWNLVTIAVGAFLLFYGFAVVARNP
jgi:hypothetical protein